jgi:hypothetical protein
MAMDAPLAPPTEIAVPLDAHAREVLLLAAQLGSHMMDDVFVSYTSLLLGLLFAKLDHEQADQADRGLPSDKLVW